MENLITFVIKNVNVFTPNGKIDSAIVIVENGIIKKIGKNLEIPNNYKVIDGNYKNLYPAIINSISAVGLVEIAAIRQTNDLTERGYYNAFLESYNAINPSSEHIRVIRSNGILIVNSTPRGSLISGFSTAIKLNGRTQEEMLIKRKTALNIFWDNKNINKIYEFFTNAKSYLKSRNLNNNLNYEAIRDVFENKVPVFVHVNNKDEILSAISFSKSFNLKIVIVGTYGIREAINEIKENNIPVILNGIHRLPKEDEPYDDIFTLPKFLLDNNINFCISTNLSAFSIFDERNLIYHASSAIAFGLDEISALNSISLNCAKILNIDDKYGSIEENKSATFLLVDGNIFDFHSKILKAFIDGNEIDLSNKHIELFNKYK